MILFGEEGSRLELEEKIARGADRATMGLEVVMIEFLTITVRIIFM